MDKSLGTVTLVCCLAFGAVAAEFPRLRHVNYLALESGTAAPCVLTLHCLRHGTAYEDAVQARLIDATGGVLAAGHVLPGHAEPLPATLPVGPRLALELRSGWNLARVDVPEGIAWALRSAVDRPLRTVGEWGPLFFWVPAGSTAVTLWVQAEVTGEAAHVQIRDPAGSVVLDREEDFDRRTKIDLRVLPEQAGRAWSIALLACAGKGWYTDDVGVELGPQVPGLLSMQADWAERFGDEWRPEEARAAVATKLAARPPNRPPYRPVPPAVLAAAYYRRGGAEWRTSLPLTYVLDYGPDHLDNPAYVPTVATAPPTLLHLGKDVALNHGWGPVRALGGENQAYGSGDAIARLSPDEVASRITALQQMTDALHAVGVRIITPYICAMTLNGDPDKRTGFWEFYDHWDEYRGLGLPPRPAADPREWLQRSADGKPRIYYTYDQSAGFYPPFKTNHRYAACWHTEGWRTWLLEVVRWVGRSGCDGVFVDNGCSQRSLSPAALTAFRAFLKSRYSAAQAEDRLGIADLDAANFPNEREASPASSELRRFWCATLRDEMAAIKEAGSKALGREFVVFPNGGHPAELQEGLRDADFVMFEKSIGDYGTNPGLVLEPVLEGVTLRALNDNLFEHLFVRSLRERVRPIILTRPGYPARIPHLVLNPDAARLGLAECAAFSGGGAFLLRPDFGVYHDVLNDYREFIESHPDLYAGLLPWVDTAILALPEQGWLGNRTHLAAVQRLTPVLAAARVRFEFVSERRLDGNPWEGIRTVGAYAAAILTDRQVQSLAAFVGAGGRLLVAGPFAEKNEFLQSRTVLPAALAGLAALAPGQEASAGQGRLVRLAREEDFAAALGRDGIKLTGVPNPSAAGVRLAAYRSADAQRLILHLVNYHVPLGVEPAAVEPAADLQLDLPLPAGRTLSGFRALSPDPPSPLDIEVTATPGTVRLRLPQVRIYAVIEIRLQ